MNIFLTGIGPALAAPRLITRNHCFLESACSDQIAASVLPAYAVACVRF